MCWWICFKSYLYRRIGRNFERHALYTFWPLSAGYLVRVFITYVIFFFAAIVADKSKVLLAKASVSTGAKNVYSIDSSMQKTAYKKKIIYKPRLSVRTPSQELIAFGGTYTNVYGRNVELDFVLDKVFTKPVIIKCKFEIFKWIHVNLVLKIIVELFDMIISKTLQSNNLSKTTETLSSYFFQLTLSPRLSDVEGFRTFFDSTSAPQPCQLKPRVDWTTEHGKPLAQTLTSPTLFPE